MIKPKRLIVQVGAGVTFVAMTGMAFSQSKHKIPASQQVILVDGVGSLSCGEYLEQMKGPRAGTYKMLYQQWGAGFMAGASYERPGLNLSASLETYTAWLDKWCSDDPASTVFHGLEALGKRLSAGEEKAAPNSGGTPR